MHIPQFIRKGKARGNGSGSVRTADSAEAKACHPAGGVASFTRFCGHCRVLDKESGGWVPMELWPGQERLAGELAAGTWLVILKARQLGVTVLMRAYVLWRALYGRDVLVVVVFHRLEYAFEFIRFVRAMYRRLPGWSQEPIVSDNKRLIQFSNGSQIRCVASGEEAARSFTSDVAIFDEAAFIEGLAVTLGGVRATLLGTKDATEKRGQFIVLSTSDGPEGDFADLWSESYGPVAGLLDTRGDKGLLLDERGVGPTGFKTQFIGWSERPGRDEGWFQNECGELAKLGAHVPKREYPTNVAEAFEHAAGRVYPLFSMERNVGRIAKIPEGVQRCRAIDWGETKSAYVVVWIAHIPGPPGFLVDPECVNTIREFIGYRFDEAGRPRKENDHTCDAIRYAVVRHRFSGMVYIYREIYRKDSVSGGWNPLKEIAEIHERSGWVKAAKGSRKRYRPDREGEVYDLPAVADRSSGRMIELLNQFNIPCVASPTIRHIPDVWGQSRDRPRDEVVEGIRMVAALIDASEDLEKIVPIDRTERIKRLVQKRGGVRRSLEEEVAREAGLPVNEDQEAELRRRARELLRRAGRQ